MQKKQFFMIVLLTLIDQISKSIIDIYCPLNNSITIINNFFYLTNVYNKGGAWSILSKYPIILIIVSVLVLLIFLRNSKLFQKNKLTKTAFILLFSGILSNLIDRLFLGYVRDFLDFKIFNYDYPIFNIADILIVVGVILLSIQILKGDENHDKNK